MDYGRDTKVQNGNSDFKDFRLEVFKQMLDYWEENIFKVFKKKKDVGSL